MEVVTIGVAEERVEALRDAGHNVVEAGDFGEDALRDAGVGDADVFVAEGREYAVQVSVARSIDPDIHTILIAEDAPDFVRGTVDVILGSGVMDRVVDAVEGLVEGGSGGEDDDGGDDRGGGDGGGDDRGGGDVGGDDDGEPDSGAR